MHRSIFHLTILAAAAVLLVGACTSSGGMPAASAAPSGSVAPSAPTELVLRVTREGGFVAPSGRLAQPPIVAVYADGRVITPAPVTMEYPGRLVAPLQVRNVGADGVRAILDAARVAGLTDADAEYPAVGVADAPDTVFVIVRAGTRVTTRFGALTEGVDRPGGQGASGPARVAAADFLARLTDPAEAFGASSAETTLYQPTAFQIWASPGAPAGSDPSLRQEPVAWPLATPLATLGAPVTPDVGIAGMRVAVMGGADAAALGPVLARANALTPFTSGGATYTLLVRPLLPGEAPSS